MNCSKSFETVTLNNVPLILFDWTAGREKRFQSTWVFVKLLVLHFGKSLVFTIKKRPRGSKWVCKESFKWTRRKKILS